MRPTKTSTLDSKAGNTAKEAMIGIATTNTQKHTASNYIQS